MEIDTDRIDDAVLALLLLGLHDGCRVSKGFDWEAMRASTSASQACGLMSLSLAVAIRL